MNEMYEVLLLNGERVGCTSNPYDGGQEIAFPNTDKVYVVIKSSSIDKVYYVAEKDSITE